MAPAISVVALRDSRECRRGRELRLLLGAPDGHRARRRAHVAVTGSSRRGLAARTGFVHRRERSWMRRPRRETRSSPISPNPPSLSPWSTGRSVWEVLLSVGGVYEQ